MIEKVGVKLKIQKFGSLSTVIRQGSTINQVIEEKDPQFYYIRAIALHAGETNGPNGNGDYFPKNELLASYSTFVGKRLDLEHDVNYVIGTILDAYPVDDPETKEFYIETISKIDKRKHNDIVAKIESGELKSVSMETSVSEASCSICGKKITVREEYCNHLGSEGILREFEASVDNNDLNIKAGQKIKAFSINRGLHFNGLGVVGEPADNKADILQRFGNALKNMGESIKHVFEKLTASEYLELEQHFAFKSLPKSPTKDTVEKIEKTINANINKDANIVKIAEFKSKLSKNIVTPLFKAAAGRIAEEFKISAEERDKVIGELLNEVREKVQIEASVEKEAKDFESIQEAKETAIEWADDYIKSETIWNDLIEQISGFKSKNELADIDPERSALLFIDSVVEGTLRANDISYTSEEGKAFKTAFEERIKEKALKGITERLRDWLEGLPEKSGGFLVSFESGSPLSQSKWIVKQGDKIVLEASIREIWGKDLRDNIKFAVSRDYGKLLLKKIEKYGLEKVSRVLINK